MIRRLALCLSFAVLAACGDEEPAAPVVTPAAPPDSVAPRQAPDVAKPPPPEPRPSPEAIDAALADLTAEEAGQRAAAVRLLLESGYTHRDLTQLALRFVRWDRDVGTLADLLAVYPKSVLPHLLHRLGRSAAVQRARICRALGQVRANANPATAVLLVRALLDPEAGARGEARLALGQVNPRSLVLVRAHETLHGRIADGSVARLDPGLLLGPGRPAVPSAYELFLMESLDAEASRFGIDTVIRVAEFRAARDGRASVSEDEQLELLEWVGPDEQAARFLATQYEDAPAGLVRLLRRSSYVGTLALALGILGDDAGAAAPPLVEAYCRAVSREAAWAPSVRRSDETAAFAWALGRMRNRSDEVQLPVVALLVHDLPEDDRILLERALMVLAPTRSVIDRLIAFVETGEYSAAAGSAFRVLGWCDPVERDSLNGWLSRRREGGRQSRVVRVRQRIIEKRLLSMEQGDSRERAVVLEALRAAAFCRPKR